MAARIEIEIVDRSPPAQQGQQGGEQSPQVPPGWQGTGVPGMGSGWEPPAPAYQRAGAGMDLSGAGQARDVLGWNEPVINNELGQNGADWAGTRLNSPIPDLRRDWLEREAAQKRHDALPLPPWMEREKNPFDLGYDSRNPYANVATGAAAVDNFAAGASGVVANLAQNNVGGAVAQVAEGFSSLAGKIPVVGPALEAVATASGQVVKGFTDVVAAFVERGKQISGYSAPLAQASAEAEVRDILFDIREAQELGTEYARLTSASSEAWTAIKEALLPIKKFLLEALASFLETVLPYLQSIPKMVGEYGGYIAEKVGEVIEIFTFNTGFAREIFKQIKETLEKIGRNTEKEGDGTDTLENMLKVLRSGAGEAGFFPLNGQGGGGGLNIPLIGGA